MINRLLENLPNRYQPLPGAGASGGFSDVLYCNDKNLERHVVIKSIRDISETDRLLDEVNALMQLRSKHVVQLYDVIYDNSTIIGIVMEFIKGNDLLCLPETIKNGECLLKVLWQIASGISDIHQAGIIHRDIKPNNMKMGGEDIVKIFDFGLSRKQDLNAKTIGFKGTFGFSAPELFQNESKFTNAIDVYAFGATVLYFIRPELFQNFRNTPFSTLPVGSFEHGYLSTYPNLIPLFEQCFSPNPTERPRMSHIRDEIGKHLLLNQHQALIIHKAKSHILNADSRTAKLDSPVGSCELYYDGLNFIMQNINGEVFVNNKYIKEVTILYGACVISLGNSDRHARERYFITFDISNPEITL
ncbi:serine/threonine-protein kinase [Neisseria sp. Ec49-e6-T10]|uniref:serine/threonine-protein kinase n=1 Tax=Neisseria sp. Ec49-e6-T10 TaxID=3140744 RepID=UPI003EBFAE95